MHQAFRLRTLGFSAFLLLFGATLVAAFVLDVTRREILRTSEKELDVHLEASFGSITLARGDRNKILEAEFWDDDSSERTARLTYRLKDERGSLKIESREGSRWWRGSRSRDRAKREWNLKLCDAIPIELKLDLGAGEGMIDLTGLQIAALRLSSGASSVELICSEPNPIVADRVAIESGVSKFEARGLANLNFRRLTFEGGVGAYKLEFGGTLKRDGDVNVQVGLGAVTIEIPRDVPTRLKYSESWFSKFDLDEGFTRIRKGVFETDDFTTAAPRLTIEIEAGIGSVRIRRI